MLAVSGVSQITSWTPLAMNSTINKNNMTPEVLCWGDKNKYLLYSLSGYKSNIHCWNNKIDSKREESNQDVFV
jgi:hypothetical protein